MATVREVAATIAGNAPLVVRMTKRAVWQGLEGAVRAALDYEAFCQAITYGTADLQEGLRAGRERRAPRFTGR
jgi:enoyl-CoA hydratase